MPGTKRRIRGSCGTKSREQAELVEQTMRLASTRRAPKDALIRIIEALYADDPGCAAPDIPLGAVAEECARIGAAAGKPPSERTATRRAATMRRLQRWTATRRPDITGARGFDRAGAQAFAGELAKEGLSGKTMELILGELSAMWNILRRSHDGLNNPWPLARPLHVERHRREAFTPAEARRIFAEADKAGHGWGLACRIAAATGLRYGDIARLRHGDIVGGAIRLKPHKTSDYGIAVVIPVPQDLAALIPPGAPADYILPEHADGYGRGWVGKHPFSAILRAAGIDPGKGYSFHSFRHFFRTQLARAGVSDELAMKLGGWTQRDTADRYDHDRRAAEKKQAVDAAWDLVNKG